MSRTINERWESTIPRDFKYVPVSFQKQLEKRHYCWLNKMKWKLWTSLRKHLSLWTVRLSFLHRRVARAKRTVLKTQRLNAVGGAVPRSLTFNISKRTLPRHGVPNCPACAQLWDICFSHTAPGPVLLMKAYLLVVHNGA